jgi:hypothetical protein
VRKAVAKERSPAFDSIVFLTDWSLLFQRNSRVFRGQSKLPGILVGDILASADLIDRSRRLGE